MATGKTKRVGMFCVAAGMILWLAATAYGSGTSGSLLPEGLMMEEPFRPGLGASVGKVALVQGKAVIMHADKIRGYWAKQGLPLFKGDTIVTRDRARIRFELQDGSVITLASGTKTVIDKSLYDPAKKTRSSFFRLTLGKARFYVTKLFKLGHSEFKIKTPTAIVGVRGSDFILRAAPSLTEVTALEKTRLEVVGLAFPEQPRLVEDFERTLVEEGTLPSEVEKVAPEEIEEIKKDFVVIHEGADPEAKVEERPAQNKEADEKSEAPEVKESSATVEAGEVLVSDQALVEPENPEETTEIQGPLEPDIAERQEEARQEEEEIEQHETIVEEQHEEAITEEIEQEPVIVELPSFPGAPE
jgi:hypothetical protein